MKFRSAPGLWLILAVILATSLTPRNAGAYLADLPQDVDVVSVEPIARRVPRPMQYLSVA